VWLATLPARPQWGNAAKSSRKMTAHTVRAHLFALSSLYRRAIESEAVPVGYNPVAARAVASGESVQPASTPTARS
jgi:hypothetical protein